MAFKLDVRAASLITVVILAIAIAAILGPIPQDPAYHQFADARACGSIPNCFNVLSNLGFVLAGFLGLRSVFKWPAPLQPAMKVFWWGILLIGPGSAWYHWAPDDARLVWDRLPMTVAFMGLFAAVLQDQFHLKGYWLPLLVGVGLASIGVWLVFDDLRFYGLVQFLPPVLILLIFYLSPPGVIPRQAVYYAFAFYVLAKGAEFLDRELLALTGWISGHTLKHLLAAAAVTWLIKTEG
ncbi:MAG: hypothetical protein AXA67_06990 [Methylothermaceae bacteria B42]|nr:MAG: hypothetical protein AXA67_06990 [Methylothermaceae bacteria B42]HHJ40229.1 hypothetical protein [Methylothermaceae bacterium]